MRKKLLTWAAIGVGAWWILTQPKPAASAVGGAFGKLGDAADSVVTFLTALFT